MGQGELKELCRYLNSIDYLDDKEYLERAKYYARTFMPEWDYLSFLNILCVCSSRDYVQDVRNSYIC